MVKALDFIVLLLYFLLIYWLSDQSTLPAPSWFNFQDKVHHAGAYFIMALLAWRFFRHLIKRAIIVFFISIAFCSLYGLTDEWHQSFIVGRHSDILDWVADTIGAVLAMYFLKLYLSFKSKQLDRQ